LIVAGNRDVAAMDDLFDDVALSTTSIWLEDDSRLSHCTHLYGYGLRQGDENHSAALYEAIT
jgi:hypothetical protein